MRPTIRTVAAKAGVSIATVSRFLNGNAHINAETEAKVRAAIADLGYVPNASARGLATKTTGTIALIFPKLSGPFFSELIRGAETEASATGYHLLIYGIAGSTTSDEDQTLGLLTTKVDGLILASRGIHQNCMGDLLHQGIPIVLLGEEPGEITGDSISPDNAGGAMQIVTHLLEHGYRRIAFIQGPEMQTHAQERLRGFCDALDTYGLSCAPELIVPGAFDEQSGYAAMQQVLQQQPRPDAVFAANDQMAIGAMAAVYESGLRIPEDIALAGFDDIEPARYLRPPLTTVHQDIIGQGQLAVRMLLARMQGSETPPETRVIPTELVIRRSCGCNQPETH
ncbi:MAG: LacI family DNA-binding transcriptional regulator [Anaerolineae bacterium]|nr:LacI family DNA-binding transcriptional regulator [Anaerolineae bacterium]